MPDSGYTPESSSAAEARLLERLRAGEEAAFDQFVRAHAGRMLVAARRYLANEEDARDAVQEAFTSAWRALPRFEGNAQLSTWLHRIVINAALMRLRRQRRKPEESIEELLPKFLEDGHREGTQFEEVASQALDHERAETRALVRKFIHQLPETHRNVLLLRDIEELDTKETADLLGITENAVKIRLHRARQALRTLLVPYFGPDDLEGKP